MQYISKIYMVADALVLDELVKYNSKSLWDEAILVNRTIFQDNYTRSSIQIDKEIISKIGFNNIIHCLRRKN